MKPCLECGEKKVSSTEPPTLTTYALTGSSCYSVPENAEHCGGEPEQPAKMHMNRLSFTLK